MSEPCAIDLLLKINLNKDMQNEVMIAFSAAIIGISIAGVLSKAGGIKTDRASIYISLLFILFAGIAAIPLVIAFARDLYVFYMPAVLPMLMALPPTVYHYIAARTAPSVPPIHWHDYILPLVGLGVTIGYWLLPTQAKAMMFVRGELPAGTLPAVLALATLASIFVWSLASCGYLGISLRRLRGYRMRLKDIYSNTHKRELRWIDWFIVLLMVLWGAAVLSLMGDNFGSGLPIPGEVVFAVAAVFLLFVVAFTSSGLPCRGEPIEILSEVSHARSDKKYARSALSDDYAKKIAARIEGAMRKDAIYLEANLSLQKLSRHIGAPPNLVSQTLNEQIGSTFFDYVAHWRIEAAKPRILSGEESVLTIAMEVGFNSRSTFYKAFKRETGMTPKAYREMAPP